MNAVTHPSTPAHSHRLCFAAFGNGRRGFDCWARTVSRASPSC